MILNLYFGSELSAATRLRHVALNASRLNKTRDSDVSDRQVCELCSAFQPHWSQMLVKNGGEQKKTEEEKSLA